MNLTKLEIVLVLKFCKVYAIIPSYIIYFWKIQQNPYFWIKCTWKLENSSETFDEKLILSIEQEEKGDFH